MKFKSGWWVMIVYVLGLVLTRVWVRGGLGGGEALSMALKDALLVGLGVVAGWMFLAVDHVIYCVVYHHELTPTRFGEMWRAGRYKEAIGLLAATVGERKRLFLRSALFQGVFMVLAFWAVTSAVWGWGRGLVLGIYLRLVVDNIGYLRQGRIGEVFWQIKREVGEKEMSGFVALFTLVFVYLTVGSF